VPARRFYVRHRHAAAQTVTIEGGDAHKIVHVLRLRTGDSIEVVDSAAQLFAASLQIEDERVRARLETLLASAPEEPAVIDVAQGIPKGAKMDYVVEKLGELGVHRLYPLVSERTIADAGTAKVHRWQRLAQAASTQSGRRDVLAVEEPVSIRELYERMDEYDLVLFPWEAVVPEPPARRLPGLVAGARRILVVIGPEGGFSHAEAEAARAAGAQLLSLGPRILRTETAALVAVSLLWYELGRHGPE
jgi:16S rRNA (uracil1498-N3)-methyltransferase